MATNYPGSLDSGTQQPSPSSSTEMDDSGFEHDVVHTNHSGAIIALETKVGTGDSNAVASSVLAGTGSGTSGWTTTPTVTGLTVNGDTSSTGHFTAQSGGADSGIVLGQAFSTDYVGLRTAGMAEASNNEYVLISDGTITLLSGGTNGDVYIRGGANNSSCQVFLDTSENKIGLTGSIGINDNSPSFALDVNGTGRFTGNVQFDGDITGTSNTNFYVKNDSGEEILFQESSNSLFFKTNGDWRAYFNSDGDFRPYEDSSYDLGTSSVRWSVIYGDRSRNGNGTVSSPAFSFANDTNTGIYRQAADSLGITTGGTERVRIGSFGIRGDDSGDVYNFDAFKGNNGSASAPTFSFDSDTDTGMYRSATNEISFSAGNDTAFTISSGGVFVPSGEDYFGVPTTGTGNDAEWASTGFGTFMLKRNSSLAAEKENITADLGTHLTADMIDSVVPKMWNRLNSPGYPEIGPLAEDMDAISPFLAVKAANFEGEELGDSFLTGINKTAYLSLLVLAVKDLRGRVAELEAA